jgi:hypothetical protein
MPAPGARDRPLDGGGPSFPETQFSPENQPSIFCQSVLMSSPNVCGAG